MQVHHLHLSSSLSFTVDRGYPKKVMCAVGGISLKDLFSQTNTLRIASLIVRKIKK